ncbi:MAG TPA: response regulator [Thermodesulfobacteriota bacterium]|nr:response regulator [Thermodesulfobacteriota bacterium]
MKKRTPPRTGAHTASVDLLVGLAEEIRTPLSNLLAMNRSLLETGLGPAQIQYAEKVQAAADVLLTVTNDILDYPRIRAGRRVLEQIDFDLRTAVESTAKMLAARARERGRELACMIHHQVPSLLAGDPGRLRRVLNQVADLALKSTEAGEMLLQVTLEDEGPGHATIHFAVMAAGALLPGKDAGGLFDFPSLRRRERKREVPEIGLEVCGNIIRMMGGKAGVETRKGQGSTFWFTAKFRKQRAGDPALRSAPESIAGRKILVIEENPARRQETLKDLRAWGCLADEASGEEEALNKLRRAAEGKEPYVLAVLRKEMQKGDGIALGRRIKGNGKLSSVSLVLIASEGTRGDGKAVQEIGFSAYLTEPVKKSHLRDSLALALARRELPNSDRLPLITRYSLEEEKKHRMRVLVAAKDARVRKSGLKILQNIGYSADAAASGREVLSALKDGSYGLVLLDVDLPGMDGFRTAAEIRRTQKGSTGHVPIVGLTGRGEKGEGQKCLDSGMDDYILKPVQAVDIADVTDRFFPRG